MSRQRSILKRLCVHAAFLLVIALLVGRIAWRQWMPVLAPGSIDRTNLVPRKGDGFLWGYVNGRDQWVIPPTYRAAHEFVGDGAMVRDGALWGRINRFGESIVPFQYQMATESPGGGPTRVVKNDKFGFITREGQPLIDTMFDEAEHFSDGLAPVAAGGKWGFVDLKGNLVIPLRYAEVLPFGTKCPVTFVRTGSRDWMVIDRSGEVVLAPEFVGRPHVIRMPQAEMYGAVWIRDFQEGLGAFNVGGRVVSKGRRGCVAALDGKWGYLNEDLQMAIPPRFDSPGVFRHGVADVILDGKRVQIDTRGVVLDPRVAATMREDGERHELLRLVMEDGRPDGLFLRWLRSVMEPRRKSPVVVQRINMLNAL